MGFILEKNSKPLTLLKGNELAHSHPVELIIEKDSDDTFVSRVILNIHNRSMSEILDLLAGKIVM